jgi:hypothetical protein
MLRLHVREPSASNPLIDRATIKAAAARNEGQGRLDACPSFRTFIAPRFAASRFGRRSLTLEQSEHGGRLLVRRDGDGSAVIYRGMTMLSACLVLTLSVSVVCAEPQAHRERPARCDRTISSGDPWSAHIRDAAKRFAIPERLLRAVMYVESVGDVHAVSSKGAMGLMQIMPPTWEDLRTKYHLGDDPFQPRDNIFAGAAYLREMLDRFGRNGFLAAYNAGPQRYQEHLVTGRSLPRETIDYVRKLVPLINGTVPIPTRARQRPSRASALDSVIFAGAVHTRNGSASQGERERDIPFETVFAAIRSPSVRAPAGKAVTDLTSLAPQADGSRSEGASDPNPAIHNPFVQHSSLTPK